MWIHHLLRGIEFWHLNCDRLPHEDEQFTHNFDACVWFDGKLWLHLPQVGDKGIDLAFKWTDELNTFLWEHGIEEFQQGEDSRWKLLARIIVEIDASQHS